VTPETASRVSPLTIIEIVGIIRAIEIAIVLLRCRTPIQSLAPRPLRSTEAFHLRKGELTARRAGGTVYFVREEIDALINRMIEEARKEVAW